MKMKNPIVEPNQNHERNGYRGTAAPQDGRIKIKHGKDKEMDYRVSVVPTLFGEKVVLRLLDKSNLQLDMTKLGFNEEQIKLFKDAINRPYETPGPPRLLRRRTAWRGLVRRQPRRPLPDRVKAAAKASG